MTQKTTSGDRKKFEYQCLIKNKRITFIQPENWHYSSQEDKEGFINNSSSKLKFLFGNESLDNWSKIITLHNLNGSFSPQEISNIIDNTRWFVKDKPLEDNSILTSSGSMKSRDEVSVHKYLLSSSQCFVVKYAAESKDLSVNQLDTKIDEMQSELSNMCKLYDVIDF